MLFARLLRRSRPAHKPGLILLLAASLGLAACNPGSQGQSTGGSNDAVERYQFSRARMGFVRSDTQTGRTWAVPMSGDGGWSEIGSAPDPAGEPEVIGRYIVIALGGRMPTRPGEPSPSLMRADRLTGRTWILEADDARSWTPVGDSDSPTEPAPIAAVAEDPVEAVPAPAAEPKTYEVDELPVLTLEQIGESPERRAEALATLQAALSKKELPSSMRIWAVRQLRQLEPEVAVPELVLSLKHEDPLVVVESIRMLHEIGNPTTLPKIINLGQHPDPRVRDAVNEVVVEVP